MGSSRRVGVLAVALAAVTVVLTAVVPLAASASPASAKRSPAGAWAWPLHPDPTVVRAFELPPKPWAPGHRGVDLSAADGQPVLASAAGVVTFSGTVVDRDVLTIAHTGGLRTSYEPVTATVTAGDVVARGQVVGYVAAGPSHCGAVTCLHWGARVGDRYVDPLRWVRPAEPPVLLPLTRPGRWPMRAG
jgi:murein DD-endopeptidase MepM/ murein hydrolase activator NlpD